MGETHGVDLDCVIAGGSWRARRAQRLLRVAQKNAAHELSCAAVLND